uniref:Msx2-interacting protein n=1 Tax=Oncorhynchus mykiss TaxID=8022 RepID=A0A8C7TJ63_ONCMY
MVRETRHLWVGNLPEHVREEKIVEHFKRYGRVESVKVLRKRGSEGGVAAFVDFVDIKSAQKAHNAVNKMGDRDLRTDYNEPGSVPSAVRGLDDNPPSSSHGRDVSGFSRGAVGPVFGPPVSIHTREGRYERIRDGSESRERAYDHSPYGHHERGGTFDRQRHYNADYYRDRTMFAAGVSPGPGSAGAMGGSFETPEPHFESRIRGDPFTLSSAARRDPYRDDRGRRVDRTYHRRSRSSHSSQSRHPSPQRTTGQTPKAPHSPKRAPLSPGRGPRSRSRSRSSSSDSVSSTSSTGSGSSDSNSSSSDGSHARSVQSSATHAPPSQPCSMVMEGDEPRRSFGIRVQNLPVRSTDTSLKDGLFHEFKKHGKVTSVQIHGALEDRYGLVFFRQQEDQEKALNVSKGKLFFGMMIEVSAWNGPETESENEFRPLDGRIDEFHPKATRTLFIGNLEKTTSYQQLLDIFQRFGEIVDIDIKKVNGVPQYAFVQYSDIVSVCKAIKKMDGEYLGSNRLKLGFGKSMPTTCVWLDGLASNITEQYLTRHFCRYGHVVKVVFDRLKGMALILYNNTDFAQAAVRETKGWKIGGNKIKSDGFLSEERPRPPYHEFSAERAYFENARTPGTIYPEDPRRDYPARSRERYSELEHYQGEHFDPRYHEDPREFRDYRDPFEQDIRKYTYIQRERERERERFEADHGMWSPSHPRRPITPSASPSPSERAPRDPERRVYSQSSERSGSCSSLSPPRFDKTDKAPPLEHGASSKSERLEKDIHLVEPERVAGAEKSKRGRRKEKGDKEKGEKSKSRKAKVQSPSIPPSETELEPSLDGGSGRGKVSDQDSLDRQRYKGDNDPPSDPTTSTSRHEPVKSERLESGKGENADKDGKTRSRKHQKSDTGNDGKDPSVDSDRLAARKRRFGDASGRTIRQKRRRLEDEDGSQPQDFGASTAFTKEIDGDRKSQQKDSQRRDSRSKSERLVFLGSHKEGQDPAMRGQEELPEGSMDPMDSKRHSMSRRFSHDGNMDQDNGVKEEPLDIDLSQSYRKQMEQRRLHQQLQEPDKQEKAGSPQGLETEDLEHRSLVHEVGKPPQDVTDHFPSHKLKKLEQFDADISAKRGDRVYRSFRQKSEDPEWHNTASPGLQHFSHHAEQDFAESSHLREVKTEDKSHPDLELAVKRTHTTQMSKPSTPLQLSEEEREKQWESRVKQDFLPDLNFSRGIGKNTHNRKRLEYGILQDLEPGEVRSDSEEDREHKPQSPMPSTSMPFSDGQRVDRFSDPKLATLERMKFYSFALDQTITPDTKALLERAKSLSSSREDNWSFLDYDSHFAGLRSRKDTEKVESAPRPTPSWYMKKKKIRSGGSEDKLDDRKEDPKPKPEEHERRELFASRFLHSSIFEQDSRRLQHLERKHEDPEQSPAQQTGQLGLADGQPDTEPVVLFHSRFLEFTRLQQQKDQQLHEVKRADSVDSNRLEKSLEAEQQPLQFPKTSEPVMDPETKPTSPAENHMISQPPLMPKEMSPPKQMSPPLPPKGMSPPKEMSPPLPPKLAAPELPPVFLSSTPPNPVEEMEVSKYDTNTDNTDTHTEVEKKLELNQTQVLVDNETSDESISPPQKSKNKKSKSPTQVPLTPLVSTTSSEKPLTRKSERTKRASSPRAESSKGNSDSKSTGKSPIHGADPEHGTEQSISVGRARRRNVKSVYATPVEEDATKGAGKDVTESPRTARKRGGDKDKEAAPQQPLEQDSLAPITSRRGRPPKNRRQGEDMLTAKGDRSKMETKDTDSNESESSERISKVSKGRHSPHGHKALASQLPMPIATGSSRKGDKTEPPEDVSQQMDFTEDSLAMQNCTVSCKEDTVAPGVTKKEENVKQQLGTEKSRDKDRQKKDPVDEKASVTKFGEKESEPPVVEEQPVLEKMEKSGRGKAPRLTRTPKSPVLKNLKIRLNVTEVKDLLQMGDEEPENGDDSSKKTKPGESTNDPLLESSPGKDVSSSNEDKDESTPETKPPIDPKTLLQQEQELEQAVENIAKLTDPTLPAESPTPLAPPSAELKIDTEEEKSANPASEYELAAAIDSIMGEDIPVPLPQEPVISAVVDSDLEIPSFVQPTKGAEPVSNISPIQGESFFPTTPRKGAKGRAKTPKRSKSQKSNKKDAVKEISSEPENTSVITSDSIPSNSQPVPETIPSTPVAGVITTTSWKPKTEHLAPKATDMPKESKLPPVLTEQPPPQHLKPVCPQTKSPTLPKPQQQPPPPPECISPSLSPPPTRPNIRPTQPSRIPVSPPDWLNQSKDAGVPSSPRASAASFENPAIPSDTEPLETERNNSDLRRILMKHKNVSLPVPCSSSVPSNLGTLSLRDPPHLPESNTPMVAVTSKTSLNDNRPHPAQPVVRPPASLPSPESKSVISVIASTATSVISRVCNPPDMEKVNMSVDRNPIVDMPLPKQTYRPPSMEDRDSGSYHGPSVGEEGGSAGRYLVESSGLGTGSSPGLRVNTSEGVVVLSHSGQIKEGPQRISAKISQIPPATVVDMESQQLVSMPQIKQEMYTHSQSNTPKCPPIQTDHGHLKTQQTVSSIKQENTGMEKLESPYPSGPQGGVVKRLQQTVGNPQGMGYHHSEFTMLLKHPKKVDGADAMNADGCKPSWTSAISPAMSLPSPAGNHVGFVPGSATDRTPSHLSGVKQEPRSPRKLGHPHSPFTKVSSPIGSSSPKGLPGMLPSSLPAMQQYVTSVHHPEQSVIMQPHSAHGGIGRMSPHRASQAIPMGHLVQGEVRVNTPPLSVMSFGMHGDPLVSPWSGPLQQRPTSPQAVGRDIVLKVNPGNVRGHEGEQDDARRFHQATGRQSATQLKAETMQPDPRGALLSGLQLDPYMSPRDLRVLMHHPQGERSAPEPHQGHIQETVPPSSTSTNITSSMSPRAHLLAKGVSEKDVTKPQEVKRPHSPPKDGMMGFRPSMAAMASPQRVQLLPSGTGASFSEYPGIYTNTRAIHSQITETSPFGINQVPLNITSGADPSQSQADVKVKQVGQQPVNMVQLLTKYPIVWQGLLALKNDQAAVQLHFVCGNKGLALRSLPLPEGGSLLRIVQRMRLEASQLDGVARRMTGESEFCLLLALPCGRDQEDVLNQTQALRTAFINYLQAKLAAGIINVPNPGSNQPAYVLQIFPPCEFSESHLSRLAPDLLNRISNISPHLMIVITSV